MERFGSERFEGAEPLLSLTIRRSAAFFHFDSNKTTNEESRRSQNGGKEESISHVDRRSSDKQRRLILFGRNHPFDERGHNPLNQTQRVAGSNLWYSHQ